MKIIENTPNKLSFKIYNSFFYENAYKGFCLFLVASLLAIFTFFATPRECQLFCTKSLFDSANCKVIELYPLHLGKPKITYINNIQKAKIKWWYRNQPIELSYTSQFLGFNRREKSRYFFTWIYSWDKSQIVKQINNFIDISEQRVLTTKKYFSNEVGVIMFFAGSLFALYFCFIFFSIGSFYTIYTLDRSIGYLQITKEKDDEIIKYLLQNIKKIKIIKKTSDSDVNRYSLYSLDDSEEDDFEIDRFYSCEEVDLIAELICNFLNIELEETAEIKEQK